MRVVLGLGLATVASLALGLPLATAQVSPPTASAPSTAAPIFTLTWDAPAECPDEATVTAQLTRHASGIEPTAAPRFRAHARVARVEDAGAPRFRVDLTTRVDETDGTRTLTAPTCGALADATVVVLALLLAPREELAGASSDAPAPAPLGDASAPAAPSPDAEAPRGSAPSRPIVREHAPFAALAVTLAAAGDVGSLPAAALGVRGALVWRPGALSLEAGASYFPGASAELGPAGAGGRVSLVAGEARGCYAVWRGALAIAPCAAVEAGRISGSAFGILAPTDAGAAWVALAPGGLVTLALGETWALRLGVDAVFPLNRATFVVGGVGNLHQPAPVVARATLGAELRFR